MIEHELPAEIADIVRDAPRPWPDWPIWRIELWQASFLVSGQYAGFWAIAWPDGKIGTLPHPDYIVAYVQSASYLCPSSVLRVRSLGAILGGGANAVEVLKGSPLCELIDRDYVEHHKDLGVVDGHYLACIGERIEE